ncbi:MAG: DUF2752 domain-containing protein [Acidobacteriota bacterium]
MSNSLSEKAPALGRAAAAVGVAAFAVGSTVVAYVNPSESHLLPVCPLYALTGIACPGCGLTRAFHALFNGDLIGALDFNLLTPVWAVIFVYVVVSLSLTAIRGRGLPMWPTNPRFLFIFMIVLLVFGVLRNIPIWPLTILYP